MSIKAIVFDYGKVICFPPEQKEIDVLAARIGVDSGKFESMLWALRGEYDRGTVNAKEYYIDLLSRFGISMDDKSIDELIVIDQGAWKRINPGTVALMEDVKKSGYVLGILSNMPHDFLAWARKNIPVFSLAQVSLFSCEVNLIKPEEAIYRKLLSMLGLEGREVVFFDDSMDNIKSARALGIQAFLWENPEKARRELSLMGIRL